MDIPFNYQELEQIYANSIGQGVRTLAVTSSVPQEGTSSIVCALAQRAKAVGQSVLVVDLNLNHPTVTEMLNHDSTQTLCNTQSYWQPDQAEHTETLILSDEMGLCVIPAPTFDPDNESSSKHFAIYLREQSHLKALIAQWQQEFDVIIFDTSPLCLINRHNIPAQMVASCCDGTLLVVQTGKTQLNELQDAISTLTAKEANLLGCVVNEYKTPLLAVEICRQCDRWQSHWPKLFNYIRQYASNSRFLNRQF